jgi:hypothetical protein
MSRRGAGTPDEGPDQVVTRQKSGILVRTRLLACILRQKVDKNPLTDSDTLFPAVSGIHA